MKLRLSIQMFLQFAIWGAWAPVLARHLASLSFNGVQIGAIYGTAALATIIAPMIFGQIADRFVATEKLLAICYACAGILLFVAGRVHAPVTPLDDSSFRTLWFLGFGSFFFFGPSLGLANSLSFAHLEDSAADFPVVRVFGTVGWIVAGFTLSFWMKATGRPIGDCLNLGGVLAIVNAIYCLTLPHTPPKREGVELFAVAKALRMLRDPSFALLMFLAFVLLMFAAMYYTFGANFFSAAGVHDDNLALVLSIGQWAEIAVMFALPAAYKKLGSKTTIAIGVGAWAARFALYAIGAPALLYVAQAIHGVCFAFSIAAAMIYVERICDPDVRASAQSLLGMVTYGFGMFAGALLGGRLVDAATHGGLVAWPLVWWIVSGGCMAVLVVFVVGFRARDVAKRPDAVAIGP